MKDFLFYCRKYLWLLYAAMFFYTLSYMAQQHNKKKYHINQVYKVFKNNLSLQQKIIDEIAFTQNLQKFKNNGGIGVLISQFKANAVVSSAWINRTVDFNVALSQQKVDTNFIVINGKNITAFNQKYINNKTIQFVLPLQEQLTASSLLINRLEYLDKLYLIDTIPNNYPLTIFNNSKLYLKRNSNVLFNYYNKLSIYPTLLCFLFFLLFLRNVTRDISKNYSYKLGFFTLLLALSVVRVCLYFTNFPVDVSKFSLFDPTVYASNMFNKSLGDLLINVFFSTWLVSHLQHNNFNIIKNLQTKFVEATTFLHQLATVGFTIVAVKVIQSLILDSQISFNILEFYDISVFTLASFLCIALLALLFIRITNLFFVHFVKQKIETFKQCILLVIATIIYCILFPVNLKINLWILLWLLIYYIILNTKSFKVAIKNKTFGLLLLSIVLVSLSCSLLLQNQINQKNLIQQKKVAERLNTVFDLTEEFNLQGYSYSNQFNIGVYKNNYLVQHFGTNSFNRIFDNTRDYESNDGKISYYKEHFKNSNITIILAKPSNNLLLFITLFNYFVVCFFVMAFVLIILPKFFLFNKNKYKDYFTLTLRSQILLIVVLAVIGIYVVLATFTVNYFLSKFETTIETNLLTKGNEILNEINQYINNTQNENKPSDILLKNYLAEKKGNYINTIYNANGYKLIDSTSLSAGLDGSSTLINNKVFDVFITKQPLYLFVTENNITNNAKCIYLAIYKKNDCIGYLRTPFNNVETYLQKETTGLIATLVNFSALFFLVIFVLVYFFANKLTNTFKLIGTKMNQINLNSKIETIEWKRKDEVGVLIDQYNSMVLKLSESAKILASKEREGAWKEMAKQVAHEIKNPLTPMKLSIQHLQYQIKQHPHKAEELTNKVVNTLVQQIDQLANIANDFSQFANITTINAEQFDVKDVLLQLKVLYSSYENIQLVFSLPNKKSVISADKLQITRVFTNLLKNAIEATLDNENGKYKILIHQIIVANTIVISICDSGKGILEVNKEKIFTPNFTTKTSGTGLGLAICKGIIENANGKIWFETASTGTTFFVELPMVL